MTGLRAYALPIVLLLAGILAAGFVVYITRLRAAVSTTTLTVKRRQVFYVADAVARAATEIAATKLATMKPMVPGSTDSSLSPAGQTAILQAELDAKKTSITPMGFTIRTLTIDGLGRQSQADLKSGPFKGMGATIQPFTIAVEVTQNGDNAAVATMRSSIERGTLSMFQFFAFIDGYAFVFNGPGGKYAGRMHVNGNLCLGTGGSATQYIEQITASGGIYLLNGSGCRSEVSGNGGYIRSTKTALTAGWPSSGLPTGSTASTTYPLLGQSTGSAQALLADTSPVSNWVTGAITTFGGQVQDKNHGVPLLRTPITGSPLAQQGRNALHELTTNANNSRFLIDPILAGTLEGGTAITEPDDVRQQKVAYKADIRIIDGIWYLRDPSNPAALGEPIWSDHPGGACSTCDDSDPATNNLTRDNDLWAGAGKNVGQDKLFATDAVRPARFSYYRTKNRLSAAINDVPASRPVVSYGTLFRDGTTTPATYVPGFYPTSANSASDPRWQLLRAYTAAQLLQGTRAGIRHAWDESGVAINATNCSSASSTSTSNTRGVGLGLGAGFTASKTSHLFNMLPLNFDVAAFQAALADTATNELGHVFSSRGRTFNGAVFISSTWPGFRDGFPVGGQSAGSAGWWPMQGAQGDPYSGPAAAKKNTLFAPVTFTEGSSPPQYAAYEMQPRDGLPTNAATNLAPRPLTTASTTFSSILPEYSTATTPTTSNQPFQQALPQVFCTDDASFYPAAASDASALTNSAGAGTAPNRTQTYVSSPNRKREMAAFQHATVSGTGSNQFNPNASGTPTGNPVTGPALPASGIDEMTRTFYAPQCARYRGKTAATLRANYNAVRVINAASISKSSVMPNGLTIVTNLPMFVLGDLNTLTVPATNTAATGAGSLAENYVPVMIGGDTVSILSNAWADDEAPWNQPVQTYYSLRNPSATTYNAEFLYGWNEAAKSTGTGCREEFAYSLRLHERWDNGTPVRKVGGSLFVGWNAVYGIAFSDVHHTSNGGSWHDGGQGNYAFDYHLTVLQNQPPAAPAFQVTATETFRRN